MYKAPASICKSITRIQRRFLWGWGKEKKSISWVSWEVVCKNREEKDSKVQCSSPGYMEVEIHLGGEGEMEGTARLEVWLGSADSDQTSIMVVERLTQSM